MVLDLSTHTYGCTFSDFHRNKLMCVSCSVNSSPLVNFTVTVFASVILAVQTFSCTCSFSPCRRGLRGGFQAPHPVDGSTEGASRHPG